MTPAELGRRIGQDRHLFLSYSEMEKTNLIYMIEDAVRTKIDLRIKKGKNGILIEWMDI